MDIVERDSLSAGIRTLKKSTDTAVLAHYYQPPDVIDAADASGSLMTLLKAARETPCRRIIVCGVYYMAETLSLLCPDKEIVLAHPQARCPMSGQVYPGRIDMYREKHPDTTVAVCVSSSAKLKAECDICVTPENAVRVLSQYAEENNNSKILFVSDCNLGANIARRLPGLDISLWSCCCPVFPGVVLRDVELARIKWPGVPVAVNEWCRPEVAEAADFCGSSEEIIDFCSHSGCDVIIADAVSIGQQLSRRFPERSFRQLAAARIQCGNMEITTPAVLERTLRGEFGLPAAVPPSVASRAVVPLDRMLELDLRTER